MDGCFSSFKGVLDPEACPHAKWNRGCKIPKDPGYPERAWGAYLPGDEPHWECRHKEKRGDPCPGEDEWTECPLIVQTDRDCLECLEDGVVSKLWQDTGARGKPLYCLECEAEWKSEDEWLEEAGRMV